MYFFFSWLRFFSSCSASTFTQAKFVVVSILYFFFLVWLNDIAYNKNDCLHFCQSITYVGSHSQYIQYALHAHIHTYKHHTQRDDVHHHREKNVYIYQRQQQQPALNVNTYIQIKRVIFYTNGCFKIRTQLYRSAVLGIFICMLLLLNALSIVRVTLFLLLLVIYYFYSRTHFT